MKWMCVPKVLSFACAFAQPTPAELAKDAACLSGRFSGALGEKEFHVIFSKNEEGKCYARWVFVKGDVIESYNSRYELAVEGKERLLLLVADHAKNIGIDRKIYYALDGTGLTLDIRGSAFKGRHELKKLE
jgi:hypothetical protein